MPGLKERLLDFKDEKVQQIRSFDPKDLKNIREIRIDRQKALKALIMAAILLGASVMGIWVYFNWIRVDMPFEVVKNQGKKPIQGLLVDIDENNIAELEAGICFAPVTTGDQGTFKYSPLFFKTGQDIPKNIASNYNSVINNQVYVSDMGNDRTEISMNIAEEFWHDIQTPVIVDNYTNALIAAPLASFLNAPILYDGKELDDFLTDWDVSSIITVGDCRSYDFPSKSLKTYEDVWYYYLELYPDPNYIVITNSNDHDITNENIYVHHLSLISAVLASEHNALVMAEDFTVPFNFTSDLGYGLSEAGTGERGNDPPRLTESDKEYRQRYNARQAIRIDNWIDRANEFIQANTGEPAKYAALVGDQTTVPMMYIKSPIWFEGVNQEEKGEEYTATDLFYGDIEIKLGDGSNNNFDNNYNHISDLLYTQEIAVGRIVAADSLDASALISRSLGYWDYSYNYNVLNIAEDKAWNRRAWILNSLVTGTSDTGAGRHQQGVFTQNGMVTEYWTPRRMVEAEGVVFPNQGNKTKAVADLQDVNAAIYDGHGYPDGWYHMWTTSGGDDADWDRIGYEDVRTLDMHACPVFGACCLSSALDWPAVRKSSETDMDYTPMTPDKCFSLAIIRAGASCYIGATEESWGQFFGGLNDGDPDQWGYGDFDMPTFFWKELFNGKDIGTALKDARSLFYDEIWQDYVGRPFARQCILETVLYGDPACPYGYPGSDL